MLHILINLFTIKLTLNSFIINLFFKKKKKKKELTITLSKSFFFIFFS